MIPVIWRSTALGIAGLLLGACGPEPTAQRDAVGLDAPPAGHASPGPAAVDFRAADVKTVTEYLAEPRYAGADLRRGELLSLACQACHTLEAGGPDNIGPSLAGIFGRPAAARPSFAYSDAMRRSGLVWTPEAVEAWLADPAGFLPGNKMTFTGYRLPEDRRDLVAFLLRETSGRLTD